MRLKAATGVIFLHAKITKIASKPADARGMEQILSLSPPKNQPCEHLNLGLLASCCLEPLCWWYLVTGALANPQGRREQRAVYM